MQKGFTRKNIGTNEVRDKQQGRKVAFTLAEVLITLGIIGVVAAMTLPTLIQSYKKQETISKLKKAYAVTANAIKMSEVENGEYSNWIIPSSAIEYAEKFFLPYFNSAKICKTYQECGYNSITPYKTILGNAQGMRVADDNYRVPIVLNDGTFVWFSINQGASTGIIKSTSVTFDINGAKEPNTIGKDLFSFKLTPKGIVPDYSEGEDCNIANPGDGWTCAFRIVENGWEFPDDYPVKL